jgi:3-hydroxyacyl-CoA dehydrogenase/enoyl-CoA hydratase/3-hydroxybutyryl-CoA epimerase
LRVESLQEGLTHPERVAGLHFFNPVHKMPLVEVARTPGSAERALALLTRWALDLGKTPVLVRDSPGFVVNRVLMPYLNEAVLLVAEGLEIRELDRTMRRFGMPLGPLELLDQIGLDVAAHVAQSMQPALAGRFEPSTAFAQMQARGWLGQKSGAGFYLHKGKSARVNRDAEELLRAARSGAAAQGLPAGGARTSIVESASPAGGAGFSIVERASPAARLYEARERMVLLMVNEAALALGEGLAADAGAIDLALVLGTGWAPHRGGPLRYAEDRGVAEVTRALTDLAGRHGPRFEPCAELRRHAETGEPFTRRVVAGMPAG